VPQNRFEMPTLGSNAGGAMRSDKHGLQVNDPKMSMMPQQCLFGSL
jgi:hypothetical protein